VRILVTGATGFIGGMLARRLLADGHEVACLVRDPEAEAATTLAEEGCELRVADVTRLSGLAEALAAIDAAYFLVHMIGDDSDYPLVERAAAARFAHAAREAGVERMIYLGGLGEEPTSQHLSARHETAEALAADGPPLTYFRAAMVIGPGSESYELLRGIAEKLPAMPAPAWLETETQPIGAEDVVEYLSEALEVPESAGREVQIGGPDVISHLELVSEMSAALGRKPPRRIAVSGAVARPRSIAAAAAAITPGDPEVAVEISLGLTTRSVVTDPSGAELFRTRPRPLAEVLGGAVDAAAGT
jgi:uncharacterized protein YbjT (DUF2867 family)